VKDAMIYILWFAFGAVFCVFVAALMQVAKDD
jgi:hypothetical protein